MSNAIGVDVEHDVGMKPDVVPTRCATDGAPEIEDGANERARREEAEEIEQRG